MIFCLVNLPGDDGGEARGVRKGGEWRGVSNPAALKFSAVDFVM